MDDKNPEYQLNIEEELPNISQSPKVFKISLIILICASVLMIAAIITLAILYKDELSKNSQNNQSTNTQPNPQPNPQIDSYSFFGNVSYNITYDEDGKIPNSFKNGGENYIESLGPVNNNQDYEKNDRNVYTLYIPQFALDRKNKTKESFYGFMEELGYMVIRRKWSFYVNYIVNKDILLQLLVIQYYQNHIIILIFIELWMKSQLVLKVLKMN